MNDDDADASPRRRGRPPHNQGSSLHRDRIISTALDIAGGEGFTAVTMHRLATDLGVTPRALYNHVDDRQDVIDGVALLMIEQIPVPDLDPADWENSLRTAYHQARNIYRKFPRAALISLDERVTERGLGPGRATLAENMLRFFVDAGLTLPQALNADAAFRVDIFGFVLLVDYRFDRAEQDERDEMSHPVPPQVFLGPNGAALNDVPLSLAAAELPAQSSDETFEALVNLRIAGLRTLID